MRILVADDDETTRRIITKLLEQNGHEAITAADGSEAWDILQKEEIFFVITDWVMPEIDGLELCRRIRGADFSNYVYILMLTSKDTKNELVEGLEAGADDFMVKPFSRAELHVRIKAGERIVQLEKDLEERNTKLAQSHEQLNKAYSVIRKDLEAAVKIQFSLLPKSASRIYGVQFDWIFLPSTFVAGDIFNYFKLDEDHLGFYLLDVAGHGIPAAMLSFTLSKIISPGEHRENLLKRVSSEPPYYKLTAPADLMLTLNERFQSGDDVMQYFTIVYGIMDTTTGRTTLTQAGHPSPVFMKKGGEVTFVGQGGYPVGIMPGLEYEELQLQLEKGDRLFLYSDGITECNDDRGEQFSEERLIKLIQGGQDLPEKELLDKIEESLRQWKGNDEFEDDVTLLALEVL